MLPPSDWVQILGIIDSADNDMKQAIITGISCIANWLVLGAFPIHGTAAGGGLRGIMEDVMHDIMFEAPCLRGCPVRVSQKYVRERLLSTHQQTAEVRAGRG